MADDINFKKVFLITLIVSFIISALIGIIIFLAGDFGRIQLRILLTTLSIGGFSLTGLCCAVLHEKKRFFPFGIIGMIVSAAGFIITLLVIWEVLDLSRDNHLKIMIIFIILAAAIAHASLLLLIKSDKTIVNVSLSLTLLFIFLVALELIILVIAIEGRIDDIWWRLLGVFAILDVLGTIITPILLKITSLHEHPSAHEDSAHEEHRAHEETHHPHHEGEHHPNH